MKIIDLIAAFLKKDETKILNIGQKISESYLEIASDETIWSNFESEILNPLIEDFKCLIEHLRKKYCIHYSSIINKKMRAYFKELVLTSEEPADIQMEFLKIVLQIVEAN